MKIVVDWTRNRARHVRVQLTLSVLVNDAVLLYQHCMRYMDQEGNGILVLMVPSVIADHGPRQVDAP